MELTILGSGGCVARSVRRPGRKGYDENILIETPAETAHQLNRSRIDQINCLMFTHLEEYWNRSHDDYLALQEKFDNVQFAYDGMGLTI
jgi:hypothetical protein